MQRFSLYGVHKRDYQESVTIGQTDARTHTQTDAGQSDPYVPLCFAGDTIKHIHVYPLLHVVTYMTRIDYNALLTPLIAKACVVQ